MSHTDDVINRTFKIPRQKQQKMEISKLDEKTLISTFRIKRWILHLLNVTSSLVFVFSVFFVASCILVLHSARRKRDFGILK